MVKQLILFTCAAMILGGCSSTRLTADAARVIVSPSKPPKGCKFVGQVIGNQGNFFTGAWTSNRNLELGALNDMKNQAAGFGANYVQLVTTRSGFTGSNDRGQQTNVTNTGNAYQCPPERIGL